MKRDPRVKLLYIILLTTLAVLAKDFVYLSGVVLAAIIVNVTLGVNMLDGAKRLRHFLSIVVFITLVQSLTVKGGTTLIHIGTVNFITTKGLIFALEFLLRMLVIILSGLIASSTDGREMADGLSKLGLPYEFVFMSGIALRFIPIFSEEFRARLNALTMRGINIKKLPLGRKIKLYGYLVSPTISGCIVRSEELAKSVESRGFRAEKKRTMYREFKMSVGDWLVVFIGLVLSAGFLFVNYYFGAIFI